MFNKCFLILMFFVGCTLSPKGFLWQLSDFLVEKGSKEEFSFTSSSLPDHSLLVKFPYTIALSSPDELNSSEAIAQIEAENTESRLFCSGLFIGFFTGCKEALQDFIPYIIDWGLGLGKVTLSLILHPMKTSKGLFVSGMEFCHFFTSSEPSKMAEVIVPEIYETVIFWDQFDTGKKGHSVGYCVGLYGLDIVLYAGVF